MLFSPRVSDQCFPSNRRKRSWGILKYFERPYLWFTITLDIGFFHESTLECTLIVKVVCLIIHLICCTTTWHDTIWMYSRFKWFISLYSVFFLFIWFCHWNMSYLFKTVKFFEIWLTLFWLDGIYWSCLGWSVTVASSGEFVFF